MESNAATRTSLRPLRPEEWDAFLATVTAGYTQDMIDAGLEEDVARAKGEKDMSSLLGQGLETPDHLIFAVEHGSEVAGFLWLAERRGELGHAMFVYAIELEPAFRGRGVGRAAMVLAEEETRERGIPKISLNVFGANTVARNLYRSLDYAETAIHMEKKL